MPEQDDIVEHNKLLRAYRTTLSHYLTQQALVGTAHVSPSVAHGILEARENIRRLKKILRSWNVDVEDLPNDEDINFLQEVPAPTGSEQELVDKQRGIVVDARQRQVWLDGQLLTSTFSPMEFALLVYLVRNAGKVCTRDDILRELDADYDANATHDERIDTLVRRLRERLGELGQRRYLIAIRGRGFSITDGYLME